jgi:deoxynucleotide monophosphate kinase-like protein
MVKYRVAISGKAKSGKNTAATLLSNYLCPKGGSKIVALADPMKRILEIMFPTSNKDCLYGPSELRSEIISGKFRDDNNCPLTYRRALTDLGKFGRKYNDNMWLDCVVEDFKNSQDISLYIIPDVRFRVEFDYLKQHNFHMLRIRRKDCSNINDVSETEQETINDNEFNHIIHNNGSIKEFEENIRVFGAKIRTLI